MRLSRRRRTFPVGLGVGTAVFPGIGGTDRIERPPTPRRNVPRPPIAIFKSSEGLAWTLPYQCYVKT